MGTLKRIRNIDARFYPIYVPILFGLFQLFDYIPIAFEWEGILSLDTNPAVLEEDVLLIVMQVYGIRTFADS